MNKHTRLENRLGMKIGVGGLALLLSVASVVGQSARVAKNSVEMVADAEQKTLTVAMRLVDHVAVTSVQAVEADSGDAVPARWQTWAPDKAPACAWMIVVDVGHGARAKLVARDVEVIRSFLTSLPAQDDVAIFTLARDLTEVVPFGGVREEAVRKLVGIKLLAGAAGKPVIYSNLSGGLARLAARPEKRQAVLLMSNGQDQSPGGPEVREIEKQKLIEAAMRGGVVIHTLSYVEFTEDKKYLLDMKELALQTDGLFESQVLSNEELPFGAMARMRGVMHGAGTVTIDVSGLAKPVDLNVTLKTSSDRVAVLQVPSAKVGEALAAAPVGESIVNEQAEQRVQAAARRAEAAEANRLANEAEAAEAAEADRLAKDQERVRKSEEAAEAELVAREAARELTRQSKVRSWVWVGAAAVVALVAGCWIGWARRRGIRRE